MLLEIPSICGYTFCPLRGSYVVEHSLLSGVLI